MYDQFLADPNSVDAAWHDFFSDFKPTQNQGTPDVTAKPAPREEPAKTTNGQVKTAAEPTPKPAAKPALTRPAPAAKAAAPAPKAQQPDSKQLRGAAAAIAKNMDASLSVPTATSVRAVPAQLMADNRIVINNHPKRTRGGEISFTHLIGYAMIRALHDFP